MRRHFNLLFPLILTLFFFLMGVSLRFFFSEKPEKPFTVEKIERKVNRVQTRMENLLNDFPTKALESHEQLWRYLDSLKAGNIDILVFQGFEMVAWTNQLLPVEGTNPQYLNQPVIRLDNGWYLTSGRQVGDVLILTFSALKYEYPYQNDFLKDGFVSGYDLDPAVKIIRERDDDAVAVKNSAGKTLFYLLPPSSTKEVSVTGIMASWIFLLMIICILWFFYNLQKKFAGIKWSNYIWLSSVLSFSVIYYLVFWKGGLLLTENDEIFSPVHFAMSEWLPSLGMFLIFSFWLFTICFWFFKYFRLPGLFSGKKHKKIRVTSGLVIFLLLLVFYLIYINQLFYLLAEHSSGPMVIIKIIDLDWIALVKILIVGFLLLSFLLLYERVVLIFLFYLPARYIFFSLLAVTLFMFILFSGIGVNDSDWAFLFYFLSGVLLIYSRRKPHMGYSYATFLWFAALFALYAGAVMMDLTIRKEESGRELLIENLSFQLLRDEDPVAEMYLVDIEKQLQHDATLIRLLSQPELDQDAIRNHLLKFYFYGYWGRYDLQIIPCWPQGDLYLQETSEIRNCYKYFFQMLENYGYLINGSNHFHYLDNHNGRVSYFGVFRFFTNDLEKETSLFIELHSKPFFEGTGYPELLVSQREQARVRLFNEYSHAKYINGQLVKRSGDYPYKGTFHPAKSALHGKVFLKEGDYSHLVYQPEKDVIVVLSRLDFSVSDVLMAFSIFFIFFFLFGALFILLLQLKYQGLILRLSIQKRIQVAFVLLMLVMLVVVASGTVYYSIQQFRQKHRELLENKIQSVLLELEYKIGFEGPETTNPGEYLNYQLQMISSVFYCDVNLYGIDGKIIGTSRQELFKKGLAGTQMNPRAYMSLVYTDAVRFLEEERIGDLQYLSFYVPLLRHDNRLAGFVNIPYFIGNNELKEEISSVIVTVINFYLVFSFVVIGFAVFLARQITRPLLTLQTKISELKLDHHNEKIDYKGDDEIGGLVNEYNRMVDALSDSADKLARTERELAWREMAKQIAHEIKNPLTPMKLSIQYLQRAWNDQVPDFGSYLTKVTGTLIEQINKLSSIASEFSKFAQMPSARQEVVNLVEKVENSRLLFQNSTEIPIVLENRTAPYIPVNADGEQLLGVFNNLIKNAIQAIPNEAEGEIKIVITSDYENATVAISDNGKGIPVDIQKNLFVPSFTTKTGGMGLGLAIARRILENAGGRIWFETEEGKGSTFYAELPQLSNSL